MQTYTPEQVAALAPDSSSLAAGRGLASAPKWQSLGRSERLLWGEMKGSGSAPYQVRVDLEGPAYKCTCPSRKLPCKHVLGLFLLYTQKPDTIPVLPAPEGVQAWADERDSRAQKKAERLETKPEKVKDTAAQEKRLAEREAKVSAGVDELQGWLSDLLRQGLAQAATRPSSTWEGLARRLMDAQAPGLAARARTLGEGVGRGEGWEAAFLERLGRLYLLSQGWKGQDRLPEDLKQELRREVGLVTPAETVLQAPPVADTWSVVGRVVEKEAPLTFQWTWLWGEAGARPAMIFETVGPGAMLDQSLVPGMRFAGELCFYPAACPLRALVKSKGGPLEPAQTHGGFPSLSHALTDFSRALASSPFLEAWPLSLTSVWPQRSGEGFILRDPEDRQVPLSSRFQRPWELLALSLGRPVSLFGLWEDGQLLPLSVCAGGRFYDFSRLEVA